MIAIINWPDIKKQKKVIPIILYQMTGESKRYFPQISRVHVLIRKLAKPLFNYSKKDRLNG